MRVVKTDIRGKSELRQKFLSKRRLLGSDVIIKASDIIYNKIILLDEYRSAENILLYFSCSNEVFTDKIIKHSLYLRKNVYLPRCIDSETIRFYKIYDISELKRGMYGISEPMGDEEYKNDKSSLCIVPGICFDKSGFRLGYGKGYYDRFLSNFPGSTLGIAMEDFVLDRLPVFKTDISVFKVVTDKNIYEKDGESNGQKQR